VIYFSVEFLPARLPTSLEFLGHNLKIPHRSHDCNFNIMNFIFSSRCQNLIQGTKVWGLKPLFSIEGRIIRYPLCAGRVNTILITMAKYRLVFSKM